MTKINEMSFFKKVIISIKDFERYPEMATQKVVATLKYLLKLIVLFTLIIVAVSTYKSVNVLNATRNFIESKIPDFYFENGVLKTDLTEPIIEQSEDLFFGTIIIDANNNISKEMLNKYKEKLNDTKTGIIFLNDKIVILATEQLGYVEYSYKSIMQEDFILTKQNLLDYFSGGSLVSILIAIFIVNFIYSFMTYLIGVLMYIILLTILGYLTATIMKMRMKIYAVFNMATHAFTLPTILFLIYIIINMFTGIEIIYFDIMYVGVAYIYMIAAILIIKSDLMKRQQELVKIIQEQKKVVEEQERKEEKEEKTKDKEEKKKEKENSKDKDEDEDGLGGTEPEPQGNMFNGE